MCAANASETLMYREAREAPERIEQMLQANQAEIKDLAGFLRRKSPPFAITVARGSSDHAAAYAKYLLEAGLGLITASVFPSAVTIYGSSPRTQGALALIFSQSGISPDLAEYTRAARAGGALTVALINREDSPLAREAELAIPLLAGEEKSVPATKSVLAMFAATAQLYAYWHGAPELISKLEQLPEALAWAREIDWSEAAGFFADQALILARGYAYPAALEMALKLKETAAIQAEAISSAEFRHGPLRLAGERIPVLLLAPPDRPRAEALTLAQELKTQGVPLALVAPEAEVRAQAELGLAMSRPLAPALDPILLLQSFYPLAAQVSLARGFDPDHPPLLQKVTRTR